MDMDAIMDFNEGGSMAYFFKWCDGRGVRLKWGALYPLPTMLNITHY